MFYPFHFNCFEEDLAHCRILSREKKWKYPFSLTVSHSSNSDYIVRSSILISLFLDISHLYFLIITLAPWCLPSRCFWQIYPLPLPPLNCWLVKLYIFNLPKLFLCFIPCNPLSRFSPLWTEFLSVFQSAKVGADCTSSVLQFKFERIVWSLLTCKEMTGLSLVYAKVQFLRSPTMQKGCWFPCCFCKTA